jgi:hypothetical protein
MIKSSIVLVAGAAILAGCATVTRGTTNQIQIRSEPSGAQVATSLAHNCMTPCTINVSRKDEFSITMTLPGYRTEKIEVGTRVAGAGVAGFAGNVIIGGVVGMGVDAVTGSTLEHYPNPVVVTLQRDMPPPAVGRPGRPPDRRGAAPAAQRTTPPPPPAGAPAAEEPAAPRQAPPQLHPDGMGPAAVPSSS